MLPFHPYTGVGTGSSPVRSAQASEFSEAILFMKYYVYILQSEKDGTYNSWLHLSAILKSHIHN